MKNRLPAWVEEGVECREFEYDSGKVRDLVLKITKIVTDWQGTKTIWFSDNLNLPDHCFSNWMIENQPKFRHVLPTNFVGGKRVYRRDWAHHTLSPSMVLASWDEEFVYFGLPFAPQPPIPVKEFLSKFRLKPWCVRCDK